LLISIITTTYNSAATIAKTMVSVSAQSWDNVEHIVVDGGSTDNTLSVLKTFKSRIATLISEPDCGIYDAMNKGIARCNGEIICFLNSDDFYAHADVLAKVVDAFSTERLDAVYGDAGYFRAGAPDRIVRRYSSARFSPERLAWGWMPAHPSLFMTAKVYKETGLFNVEYRIAGDYEYIVRAFWKKNRRSKYLSEILVKMQMGGISTSGFRNTLRLNREVLRACRENDVPTNIFKILSKYPLKLSERVL
jgi:glycosyltransferase involved in cell wall biosynthesis